MAETVADAKVRLEIEKLEAAQRMDIAKAEAEEKERQAKVAALEAERQAQVAATALATKKQADDEAERSKRSQVRLAFLGSMLFVVVSFAGLMVLSYQVVQTASGTGSVDPVRARLLLSAVALFLAVAFAAMGFGLFLIGAQGTFKSGSQTSKDASWLPAFESSAPGLVLMICATVVVYLALRPEAADAAKAPPEKPAVTATADAGAADGGTTTPAGRDGG